MNIATSNMLGNGLDFDGGSLQYVQLPNINTSASWTVSLWFNKRTVTTDGSPYFNFETILLGASGTQFLGVSNFSCTVGGTHLAIKQMSVGNTYFISYKYNGSQIKGRVDDNLGSLITISNPLNILSKRIGNRGDTVHPLNQNVYDLKIFDKFLSDVEENQLYNSFSNNLAGLELNLVANYNFNHKRGTLLEDKINGANGTLMNYLNTELGTNNSWRNSLGGAITL